VDYFFLGERDLLTAFRFAGVDGRPVGNAEEACAAFKEITREDNQCAACKILILSEQTADWLGNELPSWQLSGKYPLIVEVPGLNGHISGRTTLVDSIREAIGIHV
jgi:V/A-type H+-transporting ATPase subunit F